MCSSDLTVLVFVFVFVQFVGKFPNSSHGDPPPIEWVLLSSPSNPAHAHISTLQWQTLTFPTQDLTYEALFLRPSPDHTPKPRLVVFPHGGPHVAFPADYLQWPVTLAALGFAVLLVNYRGSMGFGQQSIYSLPGKVGDQDVKDVQVWLGVAREEWAWPGKEGCGWCR